MIKKEAWKYNNNEHNYGDKKPIEVRLYENRIKGYNLYKEGYKGQYNTRIYKCNGYRLLWYNELGYLCNCDDFVYRSGYYDSYYCKHIYAYLFTKAASKDDNVTIKTILPIDHKV